MRAVIVSLVGIALCGSVMAAQSASDLAKGDAAKGKTIYAQRKCTTCHRTDKADAKKDVATQARIRSGFIAGSYRVV